MKDTMIDYQHRIEQLEAELSANKGKQARIEQLEKQLAEWNDKGKRIDEQWKKMMDILTEHEEALSKTFYEAASSPADRLRRCLQTYHNAALKSMGHAKDFRDKMTVWFTAMELILDMVTLASTHSEKNARLRGAIEVVQRIIDKLGEVGFDFDVLGTAGWAIEDLWHSDAPTREFIYRIRELEDEKKQLETQLRSKDDEH